VAFARDLTAERELERERRHKASIATALSRLQPSDSVEETADRIARELMVVPGVDACSIVAFWSDAAASEIARIVPPEMQHVAAVVAHLPAAAVQKLHTRALQGAWTEPWGPSPARGQSGEVWTAYGVRALCFAPMMRDGTLIGVVVAASGSRSPAELEEHRSFLAEFAAIGSALLAPGLTERRALSDLRTTIEDSITRRAFRPVFQAVVELASRRLVGYEALTRFRGGRAPDAVFADADRAGLGIELEDATASAAIVAASGLPEGAWLSINASPAFVLSSRAADVLGQLARPIFLEITEHAPVEDYSALLAAVGALGPNVSLAVDDAGAGFASLHHIVELRPGLVKLDRTLVHAIDSDPSRRAVVAGMAFYAAQAGCDLLAEGVETEAERETLVSLGVSLGQGYLFARALPADDAARLWDASRGSAIVTHEPPDASRDLGHVA
jgi:EAL domain-containing protein (putative c-di-GMP-specific phosphodiesterase class I)